LRAAIKQKAVATLRDEEAESKSLVEGAGAGSVVAGAGAGSVVAGAGAGSVVAGAGAGAGSVAGAGAGSESVVLVALVDEELVDEELVDEELVDKSGTCVMNPASPQQEESCQTAVVSESPRSKWVSLIKPPTIYWDKNHSSHVTLDTFISARTEADPLYWDGSSQ